MRGKIIAGNWKMNKDVHGGSALVRELCETLSAGLDTSGVQVILCPPYPVLTAAASLLDGTGIFLGAQNMHFESDGAFTGEVSGTMLKAAGCTHVIVGHSERRQYFGETDATVHRRVRKALEAGLTPIVCVGETLEITAHTRRTRAWSLTRAPDERFTRRCASAKTDLNSPAWSPVSVAKSSAISV